MRLNISKILHTSIVDGPGVRTVIFFQGCSRKCLGCHNPTSHDHTKGLVYTIHDLMEEIKNISVTKKITISGGEPMEQLNGLKEVVDQLYGNGFNICLYTSNQIEDIPKEILKKIQYLKVGTFEIKEKDSTLQYKGSRNQKFYRISYEGELLCKQEI
nr:4Fe-4S single cluster domain-containing protein [uncultured Niameybacter sp.]